MAPDGMDRNLSAKFVVHPRSGFRETYLTDDGRTICHRSISSALTESSIANDPYRLTVIGLSNHHGIRMSSRIRPISMELNSTTRIFDGENVKLSFEVKSLHVYLQFLHSNPGRNVDVAVEVIIVYQGIFVLTG